MVGRIAVSTTTVTSTEKLRLVDDPGVESP
jgi:hypothetical protein